VQALDPRIVKVSIEVNGQIKTYEGLAIVASGTKYANPLQNEAEISISNLDRTTQDYILTQTSPYTKNRTPKLVTLEAGRQSYGTAKIYVGNIVSSTVSQPPDVKITLKCLTGNFIKGNILSRSFPGQVSFKQVSQQLAQDLGYLLKFQTNDKTLGSYAYNGAAAKQVNNLSLLGGNGLNVFVDDNVLIIKDAYIPLNNTLKILSAETGMIGIPEFTEQGIRVKFLVDNRTTLGGGLRIISKNYPAANGDYAIYKLGFSITNRDRDFYYVAEAARRR
jgi:small ligand-binding sensory domain FIST